MTIASNLMLRRAATEMLACVLLGGSAFAQQPEVIPKNFASVIGVVDDSIRGGPLVGAIVAVAGTDRRAVTDANGVFRIDSIVPGEHRLTVTHPLLEAIGFAIMSDPFTLAGGVQRQIGAHTPSYEEVRAKSCTRGAGAGGGMSILLGRVIKADTDEPAAGATVSLLYKDVGQKSAVEKVRTGRASATGMFAICGLPSIIEGNIQATFGGITTADLPVKMNDELVSTATLAIGGGSGTGTAVLTGVVKSKLGGPVIGAQVAIVGTSTVATTGSDGTFTLAALPAGTHEAVARKIGFAKTSQVVQLSAHDKNTVTIVLETAQVLGTVHVTGKLDDALMSVGFSSRKQGGRGWYLTPEQIEEKNPKITSDLFLMANGMKTINGQGGRYLASTSTAGSSSDGCMNVFIDHTRFDQFQPGDVDDAAPVADLGAIEYYASPSSVPSEFDVSGKTCATLVIWTKTLLSTLKPRQP